MIAFVIFATMWQVIGTTHSDLDGANQPGGKSCAPEIELEIFTPGPILSHEIASHDFHFVVRCVGARSLRAIRGVAPTTMHAGSVKFDADGRLLSRVAARENDLDREFSYPPLLVLSYRNQSFEGMSMPTLHRKSVDRAQIEVLPETVTFADLYVPRAIVAPGVVELRAYLIVDDKCVARSKPVLILCTARLNPP